MMISSNEETWAKLRREPGMKDRLRIRQLKYNHMATASMMMRLIDEDPEDFKRNFSHHPTYNMTLIKEMVRVFIGLKQMSIRRFTSVLKLVDEEEFEKLVSILKNEEGKSEEEVVTAFREVVFLTEVNTMVSHLKSIKR